MALPDNAVDQIDAMLADLSAATNRQRFLAAASSDRRSRQFADNIWQARKVLDVGDIELQRIKGGEVADRADGSSALTVNATWSVRAGSPLGKAGRREATLELRVAGTDDGRIALRTAQAAEDPIPLWLSGRVTMTETPSYRLLRIDGGDAAQPVAELTENAVRTVRTQLRSYRRIDSTPLTVISPATGRSAAAILGRSAENLARVAAVSTRAEGSQDGAAVVVLNPAQFDGMDRRGSQVVVSHEAVHQMTGVLGTTAEGWVGEGFADWVALRSDKGPLAQSAGQALREVRENGPPSRLPTRAEFESARGRIGAVYESSWLVFRMLDDQGVEPRRIVAFYRDVVRGAKLETALRRNLDLGLNELTRRWRAYLEKSASI